MIFRLVNPFVIFILRSPVHWLLSNSLLVLTFRGRKTGRQISVPVSYLKKDQYLVCVTAKQNIWWRNLTNEDLILLDYRGKRCEFSFFLHTENYTAIREILGDLCLHSAIDAYFANVKKLTRDTLDSKSLEEATQAHIAFEIILSNNNNDP